MYRVFLLGRLGAAENSELASEVEVMKREEGEERGKMMVNQAGH